MIIIISIIIIIAIIITSNNENNIVITLNPKSQHGLFGGFQGLQPRIRGSVQSELLL